MASTRLHKIFTISATSPASPEAYGSRPLPQSAFPGGGLMGIGTFAGISPKASSAAGKGSAGPCS